MANIQLKPTPEQEKVLLSTLERCNAACNWLSARAIETGKMRQFDLQKVSYRECRETFGLSAQSVILCISKVANAYKTGPKTKLRTFRKHGGQPYDDRIFRLMVGDRVSIWTLSGRMKIPFICGDRQRKLLEYRCGEVRVMFIRNKWYVACVCDVPDTDEICINGILGIDIGIINLAFDSQGRSYSGSDVEKFRSKLSKRRSGLQKRGTRAAKRKLKKLSGKEARFHKHVNHCISKEIVRCAERSHLAIAVENLTHIRKRVKARKTQRARLHGWSFAQLRQFITYKAKRSGIPVIVVDPRNTSRACPECGYIDKANRKTQADFSCISCGYSDAADFVAAKNIAFLARDALVTRPAVLAFN